MAVKCESSSWSAMSESTLVEQFPLHRACRDGDATLLSNLLLQVQYKSTAKTHLFLEDTYYGWTPSHWASYFGKLDCLRVLVMGGTVDNNTPTDLQTSRFNQTPSHIAAFAGHPHCLQWLLQAGADPNAKDYLGESPLHKAARSGSIECASLLANSKALIGLKNNNNMTTVDLAIVCGHENIAKYLRSLLPKEEPKPLISSNGYYGFHIPSISQSVNGTNSQDAQDSSMEIDLDSVPSHTQNSTTNGHCANGLTNTNNGFGQATVNNGDITLSFEVSQNRIPIAGKKRSREEAFVAPLLKRIRVEGPETASSPGAYSLAFNNNGTNGSVPCSVAECSVREHYESVKAEKGYDTLKYQMMMTDAHGC